MALKRALIPWLIVLLGATAASVGVALIYLPAGLIVAGVALVAIGLAVDLDGVR